MTRITEGTHSNIRTETYAADERNGWANGFSVGRNGWIKNVGAEFGGDETSISSFFAIYQHSGGNDLLWQSPTEMVPAGVQEHNAGLSDKDAIRIGHDLSVIVAVFTDPSRKKQYRVASDSGTYWTKRISGIDAPAQFDNFQERDGKPTLWMAWVPNQNPQQGQWRSNSASGFTAEESPIFAGTIPHSAEEEGLDYTDKVHLQVWRNDRGPDDRMIYDAGFNPTDEEIEQGYFERTIDGLTLPLGVECTARFRHQDTWGAWSDKWSPEITFTHQNGPYKPTNLSPSGRNDLASGYTYDFDYAHTQGLPAQAVQIQVYNKDKTNILFDSGVTSKAIAGGTEASPTRVSVAEWHAALVTGRIYNWRVRVRATNSGGTQNIWGDYSEFQRMYLNNPPKKPTGLSPSSGQRTDDTTLRAAVEDPDAGDVITQVRIRLFDITANAYVSGYSGLGKTITVTGGPSVVKHSATGLVGGHRYRWSIAAFDGGAWGAYSDWSEFVNVAVPTVKIQAPDVELTRNEVRDPSFEYTGSTYWTYTGTAITRRRDGNQTSGEACWYMTADGTTGNKQTGDYHVIDTSRPILCYVDARKEDGDFVANFTLRLACYNGSNTLLGYVAPGMTNAATARDIGIQWTRYGGIVWPASSANTPKLLSGTTKVKIEVLPAEGSMADVRYDSFLFTQLSYLPTADEWTSTRNWYGYIDGDQGHRSTKLTSYRWEGTPGDAPSVGPNILNAVVGANILFTYNSPQGKAKAGDRLVIQRWTAGAWHDHYDPGKFSGGNRTTLPIPYRVLKNEERYRMKIIVQDVPDGTGLVLEGESPWSEFEVEYTGPPELNIISASENKDAATATIEFLQTELPPEDFNRIEIGVQEDEDVTVVDVILDPSTRTWTDHTPQSGKTTRYLVRQVQNQGADMIHGRWSAADLYVDYFPFMFLKSAENPHRRVRFEGMRSSPPDRAKNRDQDSYVPWGSSKPVHILGEADFETGSITINLFDAPNYIPETAEDRLETIEDLSKEDTLVLLMQKPGERRYITITGLSYSLTDALNQSLGLEWEEADYERDYYVRTGEDGS